MKKERRLKLFLGLEEFKDTIEKVDYWCYEHIYRPFVRLYDIVKANIELLYFYNKESLYFDWDYEHAYHLFVWKLNKIKARLKADNIVADVGNLTQQIDTALHNWDKFINTENYVEEPEWMKKEYEERLKYLDEDNFDFTRFITPERTPEQDAEAKEYYTKIVNVKQEGWEAFHKTLSDHAQGWWD